MKPKPLLTSNWAVPSPAEPVEATLAPTPNCRISANIIRWPQRCACCCGPADTKVRVEAHKTTGKRVVRVTTTGWDVPYCNRCLAHRDAWRYANATADAYKKSQDVQGCATGSVVIAGVALIYCLIQWGSAGVIAAMLFAFCVGGLLIFATRTDSTLKRDEHIDSRARAIGLMAPGCCCEDAEAVVYLGWHGTVHEFWFASPQYLAAFDAANPSKRL